MESSIDGKIITGANGAGGEIGHIHVEDAVDWNCGCGNQGCLEQLASANGMVTLAKWMIRQGADTKGTTLQPETMTAKDIWDAVKADDAFAKDVAERFGKYLGLALANVASTVDPEVFVIGGGVSKAGPVILDYIRNIISNIPSAAARRKICALQHLVRCRYVWLGKTGAGAVRQATT